VVENWNSANAVICYGKASELTGANREDQEVTMLALHLLQSALVLINTIFLQRVLNEPEWAGRLTEEDRRALTPLFWTHVNPYGSHSSRTPRSDPLPVAERASSMPPRLRPTVNDGWRHGEPAHPRP